MLNKIKIKKVYNFQELKSFLRTGLFFIILVCFKVAPWISLSFWMHLLSYLFDLLILLFSFLNFINFGFPKSRLLFLLLFFLLSLNIIVMIHCIESLIFLKESSDRWEDFSPSYFHFICFFVFICIDWNLNTFLDFVVMILFLQFIRVKLLLEFFLR